MIIQRREIIWFLFCLVWLMTKVQDNRFTDKKLECIHIFVLLGEFLRCITIDSSTRNRRAYISSSCLVNSYVSLTRNRRAYISSHCFIFTFQNYRFINKKQTYIYIFLRLVWLMPSLQNHRFVNKKHKYIHIFVFFLLFP